MGWVGEYFEGKSSVTTLWNYTVKEWLKKEYKGSDRWWTLEMSKQWSGIKWVGADTAVVQLNGIVIA